MLLEIDVDVPEDRRLVVDLPPEFPTGPQRLLVSVDGQPTKRKYGIHPTMVPEREAFIRLLPELLRDYPEQFVAIKDGKVVAIAPTELGVLRESSKLVRGSFFIRRITLSEKPEKLRGPRERR